MKLRTDVCYEVDEDGSILFAVEKTANGALTACVRVWGQVEIDGKMYEYDRDTVRVRLKKARPA